MSQQLIISTKEKQENRKMQARVFILESDQTVNITSAMAFGSIVPVFKSRESKESHHSIYQDEFVDEFVERMEEHGFNPERDYVLVSGQTNGLIIWIVNLLREWADAEFIRFLFWKGPGRGYEPMEM